MPEYLLLVWENEAPYADVANMANAGVAHAAFIAAHRESLRGGNAVLPSSTAQSVRHGEAGSVTNGPWRGGDEAFCGYYVVEAPDIAAATVIAQQVPTPFGGVEVRQVRPSPVQDTE